MKRIRLYLAFFLGLAVLGQSCEDGFMPTDKDELIVEGWIDAGDFPVVIISRSLPVRSKDNKIKVSDISDYVETFAKVTVSDGENEVVLTGKVDRDYFPPYIYTTSQIRGEAGKSYTLSIKARDKVLTAHTTIPLYGPVVDSLVSHPLENNDTLCSVLLYIKNVPDRKEYFKSFFLDGPAIGQFRSTYMGLADDAIVDSTIRIALLKTVRDDFKDNKQRYFDKDSLLSIKVSTMDSVSFSFWKAFSNRTITSYASYMMSTSTGNLPTNVSGGIGYWCGYNSYISTFIVK